MARKNNFLLGNGQKLTDVVRIARTGGPKDAPYSVDEAITRLNDQLELVSAEFLKLPNDAAPGGKITAVLTMHPRYISKSDRPDTLLESLGLRVAGSRITKIKPLKWGISNHSEEGIAEQLFVVGPEKKFSGWRESLKTLDKNGPHASTLTHFENIRFFSSEEKIKAMPTGVGDRFFEIALHNLGDNSLIDAFLGYVTGRGIEVYVDKKRDVGGLTFVPIRTSVENIPDVAKFTMVRVARGMPSLRPMKPKSILRSSLQKKYNLPSENAIDEQNPAVIFDGGLSSAASAELSPWVTLIEPPGIGKAVPLYEEHGLAVTSAFLFGPIRDENSLARPVRNVDHVRVLDEHSGNAGPEMVDVIDRIVAVLTGPKKYDLVNISVGPDIPVDDDDVCSWTARLDQHLSSGESIVTAAAGNTGELDAAAGLNRFQPPGDGVNILTVGAANSEEDEWTRASYSGVGPGRCPGIVKPDGVFFGGVDEAPFYVVDDRKKLRPEAGTSFAAPSLLRIIAATKVKLGADINSLGLRALFIHRASQSGNTLTEVGWGRFERDPDTLITCDDDEVLVLYQDALPVGQHLRAKLPLPAGELTGKLTITATMVIAAEVDPEFPSTYTRAGLEVYFRPHSEKFDEDEDGDRAANPKTRPFFSQSNMYATEQELRDDAHKWEPCIRNSETMNAASIKDSYFDIYYHHREAGAASAQPPKPIPYALVVSIKAPKMPDLYNNVVRTYSNILLPIKPKIDIQIQI